MAKELGERAKRTREHILAQGMQLMKERGFKNTAIRDICEAAEVSVGTFYAYFKDKGELFRYNFQKKDQAFAEFLLANIGDGSAEERIMDFVRYYSWLNVGTGREELERIFLQPHDNWFHVNNPAYHVLYLIILEGQKSGELVDQDPNLVVDMIRVFLRGCIYEWIMGGYSFDLEAQMCAYVGQLVKSFCIENNTADSP